MKIPENLYESCYEDYVRIHGDGAVGESDFDLTGRIELGVLQAEGLRPEHMLVDFGCGSGRLAVHAIAALIGGHYAGVDISQTMLDRAQQRISAMIPRPPCRSHGSSRTSRCFRSTTTPST